MIRAAIWSGIELTTTQVDRLEAFALWLGDEAIAAGGLGPDEGDRIIDRHVADSLVFGGAWRDRTIGSLGDLGSGVGLPGIPLAIAFPEVSVTLVDRSGTRCRLARRAIRVLGLENVAVREADATALDERFDVVTFRGFLPPVKALAVAMGSLEPGGIAVGAASRSRPPEGPALAIEAVEVVTVPVGVLDSPAWLLRMAADH